MWALVTDNTITKIINQPRGMVIGDTQYSRNIFSFRWSNEEREAIGIYEVVFNNTKKKDEEYYTNTNQTFTYDADAGTVTATYGDATAKAHADTLFTSDDEDNGLGTEGEVKVKGLKTLNIENIKLQAASELARSDWYIVRKADADTAAYGQIWVNTATPNQLYFTDDAGYDQKVSGGTAFRVHSHNSWVMGG